MQEKKYSFLSDIQHITSAAMLVLFLYGLASWTSHLPLPSNLEDKKPSLSLTAILMRTNNELNLIQKRNIKGMKKIAVSFHHDQTALISDEKIIALTQTGMAIITAEGDVRHESDVSNPINGVAMDEPSGDVFFTENKNGIEQLSVRNGACKQSISFPLKWNTTDNFPEQNAIKEMLPRQRKILLSPFKTHAVVADSALGARLMLTNLIDAHSKELSVPNFSDKQSHYSPVFIDDSTLLFSITDNIRWATYLYHVTEDRYEKFSDNFTDRAFFSTTGKLVLLQSFYDNGKMNVPFGSYALYARKKGISRTTVDQITGSGARAQNIRALLFESSEGKPLRFKQTLLADDFNNIKSKAMRQSLLSLWQDFRYPASMPEGTIKISGGTGKDDMKVSENVPFSVDPLKRYFEYTENIAPLLRALEFPIPLIVEYENKRLQAETKGQSYELVDLWWN